MLKRAERGTAPLETIFAIVFLMFLVLGAIQVTLVLYAKNVVASSAHEGARSAIELGRDPSSAERIARSVVTRSAGGLVRNLDVTTQVDRHGDSALIVVKVTGSLAPIGPLPVSIPFETVARASRTAGLE